MLRPGTNSSPKHWTTGPHTQALSPDVEKIWYASVSSSRKIILLWSLLLCTASVHTAGSEEKEGEEPVSNMYLLCLPAAAGIMVQYPVTGLHRQRLLALLAVNRMNPSLDDSSVGSAADAAAGIKEFAGVTLPRPLFDGSADWNGPGVRRRRDAYLL